MNKLPQNSPTSDKSSNSTSQPQPELSKNTPPETTISLIPQTDPHSRQLSGKNGENLLTRKNKSALDTFEKVIGGREKLIDILSLATLDKKQEHFLRLLEDPDRQTHSLVLLAKNAGLKPTEVLELFKASSIAASHAIVSSQLSESLPAVVRDLTDKSVDAYVECTHCRGEKYIDDVKCPVCSGKGEIFRSSDLDRQKIVLEATGIIKKGGGVNVNVQQNNVNNSSIPNFSKFVKSTDELAYSVEGELIEIKQIEGESTNE